jgi:hypothetical protein
MAKLRVDKIASVGVSTETTGSVFFDGSSDYLTVESSTDFAFGTGDFTIELWAYFNNTDNNMSLYDSRPLTTNGLYPAIQFESTNNTIRFYVDGSQVIGENNSITAQTWHHIAVARSGSSTKMFVDGRQIGSTYSDTNDYLNGSPNRPIVGVLGYILSSYNFNGYISNLRVCKGHAVYTSNFAVPTRELEVHQGPDDDRTVLLCCYDGENIFADKTGRHIIAAYGDRTSSPTPTATDSPIGITTFQPGLDRDVDNTFGPTFQGGAGYASQNWLTLPKGTTTERFPSFAGAPASSARGLFGGGSQPFSTKLNLIEYITISTTGNAQDFGDLTVARGAIFGCSSNVRGVFAGGASPSIDNTIDYVTISSTGDAKDFGDLTNAAFSGSGASNSSRGIFALGQAPSHSNIIDFITISTGGNGLKFGDLSQLRDQMGSCASSTRGLFAGGLITPSPVTLTNIIDYVNISSTGNAVDFGDLLQGGSDGIRRCGGLSNATRGLFAGGESTPTGQKDIISFITMATLGDAQDFGDLSDGASQSDNGASSSVRGVFHLTSPANTTLHFLTINTLGDSTDFGDMTSASTLAGMSNGHGGLG